MSVGQFGFGVIGDAGFCVLLYVRRLLLAPVLGLIRQLTIVAVDRLHLLVPVLATDLCGVPLDVFISQHGLLALPLVEQVACCGRVGGEAKVRSHYSQFSTITFVVF